MEINNVKDSRLTRVTEVINNDNEKKLTGMNLIINISGTLPIVTTETKVIDAATKETMVSTPATPTSVINFITDSEYKQKHNQERFVFMSRLTSPLSGDEVFIVYDKKYSDIIIIPTLSTLDVVNNIIQGNSKRTFGINGYRIGSGCDVTDKNPGQLLPTNEQNAYKIPLAKGYNSTMKTLSVVIANYTQQNSSLGITHNKIDNNSVISYNNQQLGTCINLGKVTDLLTDVTEGLPLYLLFRYSPSSYCIKYIDRLKSGDYDLLVFIPF